MSEFGKILGKERMMYKTSEEERKEKKWERDRKRMRDIRLNMPEQEKAAVREYDRTRNRAYEQSLDPEKN